MGNDDRRRTIPRTDALLAFAAAVGGIAIKSMIIGTLTPLGETSSMVSSALMLPTMSSV